MTRRVVLTGLSALSPNGVGVDAYWDALFAGRSGIRQLTLVDAGQHRHDCGGEVVDFDPRQHFTATQAKRLGRAAQFSLVASQMAWEDAGLAPTAVDPGRIGVVSGAAIAVMDVLEDTFRTVNAAAGPAKLSPFSIARIFPHAHTANTHHQLDDAAGFGMTVSTACTSGSNAMALAADRIRSDRLDVAICGAADAGFSRTTFNSFEASRMMYKDRRAPEAIMRPYNGDRDGGVLSEGAAYVMLEDLEHARVRGAHIYAEWLGHSAIPARPGRSATEPVRRSLAQAMAAALQDAALAPDTVEYVSAHATSSVDSDVQEARAIWDVFGPRTPRMPVSSIKSMIGNPIGAVGPLQVVGLCGTFARDLIPPTINSTVVDPECRLDVVPNVARRNRIRVGMINTYAIDGSSACIVLGAPPTGTLN